MGMRCHDTHLLKIERGPLRLVPLCLLLKGLLLPAYPFLLSLLFGFLLRLLLLQTSLLLCAGVWHANQVRDVSLAQTLALSNALAVETSNDRHGWVAFILFSP